MMFYFQLVMNYRVATSFPCDSGAKLGATAHTLCFRDLVAVILPSALRILCVLFPKSRPAMSHLLSLE